AWWTVSVEPSYHESWIVGAIHEEDWPGGPAPGHVVLHGFVADKEGVAVAVSPADPGLAALKGLNPFRVELPRRYPATLRPDPDLEDSPRAAEEEEAWDELVTLDGLGYELRWETRAIEEGRFAFANPTADWLVEFERVLFGFARQIVLSSAAGRFQ